MNIKYAIAASLLVTISAFAQKDELKALKKLDETENPTPAQIQEYKTLFSQFESKMGSASDEQKRDFYYYRGTYYLLVDAMANPQTAMDAIVKGMEDVNKVIDLEKNGVKKKYTEELEQQTLPEVKQAIMGIAKTLSDKKMYKEAGVAYALAYKVDPKDSAILYNAAAMAVNGQDYDKALEYYLELDKVGFTGEGTNYVATNKASGEDEYFPNRTTMDLSVKQGLYSNPREEKLPSLKGDIVKNIALIYNMKGETEKAKQAFANARKSNPNDASLLVSEAELYLKTGDNETYKKLITEATQKSPNDADLFYNLGVVSSSTNADEAVKHYKRALEINPNYKNALINLGVLMLAGEQKIVDEMNGLGNSAKDNKRYDELKKQRNDLYNKALPYFEKAHIADPNDEYVKSLLANVYQAMDRMEDYKAIKAKMKG